MVRITNALLVALVALSGVDAAPKKRSVELHAHRGGAGLRPESTLYAFAYALEVGATALEMDTLFTKDGVPVIWHDHSIDGKKCKDTGSNKFVGKYIANMTLAEVKTLDCGSQQYTDSPQQHLYPGAQIQTLEEVLDLIDCYGACNVMINLETKLDPLARNETFDVAEYTKLPEILVRRGYLERTYIQSFDWRTLINIKKAYPKARTVALADPTTTDFEIDRGVSGWPWLGGLKLTDFGGDWIKAAKSIGVEAVSAWHGGPAGTPASPGFFPWVSANVVARAKEQGLGFLAWTVNDETSIEKVLKDGVTGVITDYPERVIAVGNKLKIKTSRKTSPEKKQCWKTGGAKV